MSFIAYQNEKKKYIISRNNEIKPCIAVDIKEDNESGYYELSLTKLSKSVITDVFVYDELLTNKLEKEQKQLVKFYPEKENNNVLDLSGYDKDLIDESDKLPKYVLISCCDADNQMWQAEYLKLSNGNEKMFVLKDIYLV